MTRTRQNHAAPDERETAPAQPDPDHPADQAEHRRFGQELDQDVPPRAPSALRRPISRVRSVTETSMMFMIPIPPTSSEMAAMPPRKMVSTEVIVRAVATKNPPG